MKQALVSILLCLGSTYLLFWSLPGTRPSAAATHGMVVSASKHASDVGVEILAKGGHAVDAAVATGFALAVVHPAAGNIGGGGFMVIHDAQSGVQISVDYREMAPAAASREMYLDEEGNVVEDSSIVGYLASGVPGAVAGMHLAWEKFGRIPWAQLLAPAIELAGEGFPVSRELSRSLESAAGLLSGFPESRRIFLRDGDFYQAGEIFRQPELAQSLERIAQQGPKAFYEGRIADQIVSHMQANGGNVTLEDLKRYRAKIREPIRGAYRGNDIISMGPPSSGGVMLVEMLNMVERFPMGQLGHGSGRSIHLLAEIMRRAFADRAAVLGDPDFSKLPVSEMTSKEYALDRSRDVREDRASLSANVSRGETVAAEAVETTHYSVVDRDGNGVATTTTLNGLFGSGVTILGTGFLMNNEMDDFASKPGEPNMFGLVQGEANSIAPDKRPLSSMTPTLVMREGKLFMVLGSPGGPRIINTVLQVLMNVVDHGFDIQAAVSAPRVHHQWLPDELVAEEASLAKDVEAALRRNGHTIVFRHQIGRANCILIDPDSGMRLGAPDPRSDSAASGY